MTDRARIESVFEAALDVDGAHRIDFVSSSCGDDEAMREAVLRLLAAHDRQVGILESDPVAFTGAPMPARLGPYRLHREIGSGGMGVVYNAERDDGQFQRRVAIKIMRQGSDPETLSRIVAERQILAALDHPNIARLLDGGATPDGRPYLVMEHVDGLAIDVYCERMQLTVAERLDLFMVVARAVDFAHRNLIVHRDLKPSNIMVTADGRVKLLDFGVAKLLNPFLAPGMAVTREVQALTREYASPEQLRGEGLTTTTDVYSLGVVLYELLTGRRPHEEHEGSLAEHVSAVCDGRIDRASGRSQRFAKELRGDVDAILEMALRPEPLRRYGSAELLAQDIGNHLAHRAVSALHGSRGYAFSKLVRRNRPQAAALALALVAVLGGAGAAVWQATVAGRERERAERALSNAEEVSRFLISLFDIGDPPTANVSMHDLVRRGRESIGELDDRPDFKARLLGAMGSIHEGLGEYDEAQRLTEQAISLLEGTTADSAAYARLLVRRGILLRRRGDFHAAELAFHEARTIQERVVGLQYPDIHDTFRHLAEIAVYRRDLAQAERRARETLDIQLRVLGEAHRFRVNTLTQLGSILLARRDFEGAERTLRAAIALRPRAAGSTPREIRQDRFQLANVVADDPSRSAEAEALFRAELETLDPTRPEDYLFVIWAESGIARAYENRGDFDTSVQRRRQSLGLLTRRYSPDHPSMGEAHHTIGLTLLRAGRPADAQTEIEEAARVYRLVFGERHPSYATIMGHLGEALAAQGQLEAADSAVVVALEIREQRLGRSNALYITMLRQRASIRMRLGYHDDAETMLRDALELSRSTPDIPADDVSAIHTAFADLYTAWGRPADAARYRDLAGR